MENTSYLKDWIDPNYQKKSLSKEELIKKSKKRKKDLKFFEITLVFNIGFFVTSVFFTILFRFERSILLFTLYLLIMVLVNMYSYFYTKKEIVRIVSNICDRRKELEQKWNQ